MIYSMTGYGRAEQDFEEYSIAVEIRSVNSRYLDINFRTPEILSTQEYELKKVIQEFCTRGQLSVRVNLNSSENRWTKPVVDHSLLSQYQQILQEMQNTLGIDTQPQLSDYLRLPDVVTFEEDLPDTDILFGRVESVLKTALAELQGMRQKEGETLKQDFSARLTWLEEALKTVQKSASENSRTVQDSLRGRIDSLLDEVPVDEDRLAQEVAYLADKVDTTEEIVRFQSHIQQFRNLLNDGDAVGKKLNFLLQEMNREINTIGAKSNSSEISHLVVDVKNELEKLREQVQNIE